MRKKKSWRWGWSDGFGLYSYTPFSYIEPRYTSDKTNRTTRYTWTYATVAVKTGIADATEVSNCINAGCILAAVVNTTATFIDIWRLKLKNTNTIGNGIWYYSYVTPVLYLYKAARKLIRLQFIPEHMRPSPVKPGLQMQLKFPTVLMQDAFLLQLWIPALHSSTSGD